MHDKRNESSFLQQATADTACSSEPVGLLVNFERSTTVETEFLVFASIIKHTKINWFRGYTVIVDYKNVEITVL